MLAAAALVAGCAGSPAAPAADAGPCAAITAQAELTACWSAAARAAEAAAQARFTAARGLLTGGEPATLLDDSQSSWQGYRDSQCALFAARLRGGSAAPMATAVCRWRLAREREVELWLLIDAWATDR